MSIKCNMLNWNKWNTSTISLGLLPTPMQNSLTSSTLLQTSTLPTNSQTIPNTSQLTSTADPLTPSYFDYISSHHASCKVGGDAHYSQFLCFCNICSQDEAFHSRTFKMCGNSPAVVDASLTHVSSVFQQFAQAPLPSDKTSVEFPWSSSGIPPASTFNTTYSHISAAQQQSYIPYRQLLPQRPLPPHHLGTLIPSYSNHLLPRYFSLQLEEK